MCVQTANYNYCQACGASCARVVASTIICVPCLAWFTLVKSVTIKVFAVYDFD